MESVPARPETAPPRRPPRGPARRTRRTVAAALIVALLAALVVPLLWPVPPLPDAVEAAELAGPESRFVEVEGITYHYRLEGDDPCAVLFLHGFGASLFSWRESVADASARCTAVAFDRPAFGLTERPLDGEWEGPNPYSPTTQADHAIALMDALGIERAVLVGHSAGGAIAVIAAARHPERVRGLVLEAPAVLSSGGTPRLVRPLLATPQARRVGPLVLRRTLGGTRGEELVRAAWADPDAVSAETIEGYRRPLQVRDWDRALWELVIAPRPDDPAELLSGVECPVLVIAGTEDRAVPFEDSARVAELLDARLATFEGVGHIPHEEAPERFASELYRFLDDLDERFGP